MGCGHSKGVAPEAERDKTDAGKSNGVSNKTQHDLDTDSDVASAADGVSVPAAQQTLFQNQQRKPHDPATQLVSRLDSLDSNTPPVVSPTAKQQAAPEPEFDYSHELNSVQATAAKPATTAAGAPGSRPSLLAPLSGTNTVGGLLLRQPDWLSDSKSPLPPAATYSNSVSGQTAAVEVLGGKDISSRDNNSSSIDANIGRNSSAATGLPALPPITRGVGAAAGMADAGGSSLPPITGTGLLQPFPKAAEGSAAAHSVALPEPRRLTGNATLPVPKRITGDLSNKTQGDTALGNANHAGAARSSRTGTVLGGTRTDGLAADAAAGSFDGTQGTIAEPANLLGVVHEEGDSRAEDTDAKDSVPSPAGRRSTSTQSDRAAQQPAAACDPSDPWSALQGRYVAATNSPSPGDSFSGANSSHLSRRTTAAAAAAVGSPGSRRATSNLAGPLVQPPADVSNELVLVDSDEEDAGLYGRPVAANASNNSARLRDGESFLQAEQPRRGADLTPQTGGVARLAAESSRARVGAQRPSAGGWGDGDMAAAGTLMLGDEASEGRLRQNGMKAAAAQDDVFGDNSPRPNVGSGANSSARGAGVAPYARLAGERSSHVVGHGNVAAAGAEDELGVEEIDDVDALIEAELAAKNALPGDLAAKLAQFEALAADDD